MIYLCATSPQAARRWMADNDASDVPFQLVTSLEKAHGHRPLVSDRVVLVGGGYGTRPEQHRAYHYLVHAQELARGRGRRDTSLRQSP